MLRYGSFSPKKSFLMPVLNVHNKSTVSFENLQILRLLKIFVRETVVSKFTTFELIAKKMLFLCYVNLNVVVMSEMRYSLYSFTSSDEKDFYFYLVQKRFCFECIRHFCLFIIILFILV